LKVAWKTAVAVDFSSSGNLAIQLPRIMVHEKSLGFYLVLSNHFSIYPLNMPNNSQPTVYVWEFLSFAFWGCLGFAPRVYFGFS